MSFKPLFAKSLAAGGNRLHVAAHSHHLWPDASFDAQVAAWDDAARLADRKWDKVMGDIWPEAQAEVAAELGTASPSAIVFSSNTHDFVIRLAAACPRRDPQRLRVLTSDGEFHSARRQFARWAEDRWLVQDRIAAEPFDDLADRFLAAARSGDHDLIFISHVLFGSGRIINILDELAALARPEGPWVVVDGYHSFMALDAPLTPALGERLFFLGGGYKYAMAGEGLGILHCPPGFGPRPPITGWYAEFGDLKAPPGGVGYTEDAMRFMGATFDPTVFYRFTAIRRMLQRQGLTTAAISAHVATLQARTLDALAQTALGQAELLNPLGPARHARFLALRSPAAPRWQAQLLERNCVTDVRGDVLRIGFGLYHDADDIDRLGHIAGTLD
jgi:selenocysteine lyase/cysteine desulfurase